MDADKEYVINQSLGYAFVEYAYDSQGRLDYETYYDQEGRIVNCAKGYARIGYAYDSSGNEKERIYYDKEEVEKEAEEEPADESA